MIYREKWTCKTWNRSSWKLWKMEIKNEEIDKEKSNSIQFKFDLQKRWKLIYLNCLEINHLENFQFTFCSWFFTIPKLTFPSIVWNRQIIDNCKHFLFYVNSARVRDANSLSKRLKFMSISLFFSFYWNCREILEFYIIDAINFADLFQFICTIVMF